MSDRPIDIDDVPRDSHGRPVAPVELPPDTARIIPPDELRGYTGRMQALVKDEVRKLTAKRNDLAHEMEPIQKQIADIDAKMIELRMMCPHLFVVASTDRPHDICTVCKDIL